MALKLTDRLVRSLPRPDHGNRITYDTEIAGFGVRLTAAGARSFILNYRASGRERRFTIGAYPDWSVAAAREQAKGLKRDIDIGHDPMGQRHEDRAAPRVSDLAKRYLAEHASRKAPRTYTDECSMVAKLLLPALGKLRVHEVKHDDIDRLHREISSDRPIRANRLMQMASKMFALAIWWEYRRDNPVRGWHRNPETRRTRYLSADELQRLTSVLNNHVNRKCAHAIQLLLMTGARRGEVLNARWDEFDVANGVWVKPSAHTKQKRQHRVPISGATVELLQEIRVASAGSQYLFPGALPDKPLQELKTFWTGVCNKARLSDFRIHDLRHSYAAILASSGLSLPIIGALLGHTQPNTTARYSHLFDHSLREATERVSSMLHNLESKT